MRQKLLLLLAVLVVLSGLLELERKPNGQRHHAPTEELVGQPDTVKTSVQITI